MILENQFNFWTTKSTRHNLFRIKYRHINPNLFPWHKRGKCITINRFGNLLHNIELIELENSVRWVWCNRLYSKPFLIKEYCFFSKLTHSCYICLLWFNLWSVAKNGTRSVQWTSKTLNNKNQLVDVSSPLLFLHLS